MHRLRLFLPVSLYKEAEICYDNENIKRRL